MYKPDHFLAAAIEEARKSQAQEGIPIGAVLVAGYQPRQENAPPEGTIVAVGHNQRVQSGDPTAHAETVCIRAAGRRRDWHDLTLYTTLRPCTMCAGALVLSRIQRLVYGPADPKAGACESLFSIPTDERLNHRIDVTSGVLADEGARLLREFFAHQRSLGKK